jgi:hypothetical protein
LQLKRLFRNPATLLLQLSSLPDRREQQEYKDSSGKVLPVTSYLLTSYQIHINFGTTSEYLRAIANLSRTCREGIAKGSRTYSEEIAALVKGNMPHVKQGEGKD